ncbi:unnamed protein product [Prorocentrum cordatum]|uniref:Inositol hexakisphosphate and diphosphoinositol-pentakisphosphate kinase n=1 Tax=Prorocentrum cordatum TaxID=2364126 RepID=A0ABN9Q8V7_9DINO|nr:unnamed protein product [Polarella glacialis]
MKAILELLVRTGEFEVVPFPEKTILEDPVEAWPHPVEVLISFFSDGFPLDKAEAYVELRKPHVINNLTAQRILLDRRQVYALLSANGIPHPQAVIVERDPETKELCGEAAESFEEGDDFVRVGDRKVNKPFVEKPVDAEDHNICIYYASSNGGGVKRLFRKVGDRSSEFDQETSGIRRDGTYMYEAFMQTQGTDIKVYTVGPEYAHAEARKSPVIDGVVQRDQLGKELRFPVVLTAKEKEIARRVCLAFGQTVCGFDLLRTETGSYVIDVNGWSFVKGLQRYYEDAAMVLRKHMLGVTGRRNSWTPQMPSSIPSSPDVSHTFQAAPGVVHEAAPSTTRKKYSLPPDRWDRQELLAVLAVMRHGDRTPKNKMKMTTCRAEFLQLHKTWASGPQKEVKLKTPKQLQQVLDITHSILPGSSTSDGDTAASNLGMGRQISLDEQEAEAVQLIKAVLETGGHFDGIYRKVQLKPTAWHEDGSVQALQLVLKYGGIITPAGVVQAENLGHSFRGEMYPGNCAAAAESRGGSGVHSNGLLRLHATQRHDFKVYSSDEGRVQMTAAAFTRGLLDLEKGNLTPICAALVQIDPMTLDDLPPKAQPLLEDAKQDLYEKINGALAGKPPASEPREEVPGGAAAPAGEYGWQEMHDDLVLMQEKVEAVVEELKSLDMDSIEIVDCAAVTRARKSIANKETFRMDSPGPGTRGHASGRRVCCSTCRMPILCLKRWEKLAGGLVGQEDKELEHIQGARDPRRGEVRPDTPQAVGVRFRRLVCRLEAFK